MKNSHRVFICYAQEDSVFADYLYDFLKSKGYAPWMDKYCLLPGQDWELEIINAIKSASFFVACLSSNSVTKRGYVQKELKLALSVLDQIPEGDIFIIPIRLDDCQIPSSLAKKHWLNWDDRDSKKKLLASLMIPDPISLAATEKNTSGFEYKTPFENLATMKRQKEADEVLTTQGIKGVVDLLDATAKLELLFAYEVSRGSLIGKWEGKLLYCYVYYTTPNGAVEHFKINNYDDTLYSVSVKFGLGDEAHYVREKFIEALQNLSKEERTQLFSGFKILRLFEDESPK